MTESEASVGGIKVRLNDGLGVLSEANSGAIPDNLNRLHGNIGAAYDALELFGGVLATIEEGSLCLSAAVGNADPMIREAAGIFTEALSDSNNPHAAELLAHVANLADPANGVMSRLETNAVLLGDKLRVMRETYATLVRQLGDLSLIQENTERGVRLMVRDVARVHTATHDLKGTL